MNSIDHIVMNVEDVERTADWYVRVLGMTRETFDPGNGAAPRVALKFGTQKINVRPASADKVQWFTGEHAVAGSEDLCFLTESPPDEVAQHFRDCGVAVELGPVRKQGARGALRSVYCRDPDGNLIEVSSYEP
ncbi:MAG TPA: VOC family protein [Candidatus Baltobacteraceae bacterium]|nr:VOC family protein [Candidatus Baltobacteraceae bacterium]